MIYDDLWWFTDLPYEHGVWVKVLEYSMTWALWGVICRRCHGSISLRRQHIWRFSSVSGFVWNHDKYINIWYFQTNYIIIIHHHFPMTLKNCSFGGPDRPFFWTKPDLPSFSFRHFQSSNVRLQMWWLSGWGASNSIFFKIFETRIYWMILEKWHV